MIVFPNCKINLGLRVLGKRGDGYHNIETIFFPVPLRDALEVVPSLNNQTIVYNYGLPVQGEPNDNICIKAWHLLKKDFPALPAVTIHLLKNIPMGAGLGGGSADGAFMLQLLNNKYQLQLTGNQLIQYALQLGSDCPFFILNQPAWATGRGEILQPVSIKLPPCQLVIANPGIHINTGWAFSQLIVNDSLTNDVLLSDIIIQPVETWKDVLKNDFEQAVFDKYPSVYALKKELYGLGAIYAAMTGSGSTVFGLFNKKIFLPPGLPAQYTIIQL